MALQTAAQERARIIALLRREAEQARREGHRTTQLVIEAMVQLIEEEGEWPQPEVEDAA